LGLIPIFEFLKEFNKQEMKTMKYLLSTVALVALLFAAGCGSDDGPKTTTEQQALARLAGTWTLQDGANAVTQDGQAADRFVGFSMTISGTVPNFNFTTSPGGILANPWPASGTFSFPIDSPPTNTNQFTLRRNSDGVSIQVSFTSDTALTLTFTQPDGGGAEGGRVRSVGGLYVFSLKK
jgi:hypothetical protein